MAENPYLDLAIEVAVNRYNLDETIWGMTSFSESSKTISVGLSDGETKMKVTFDREDIRFEEMKRWTEEKKLAYVKYLVENEQELPDRLVDSFHNAMIKLDLPTASYDDEDDTIIVEEETEVKPEEPTEEIETTVTLESEGTEPETETVEEKEETAEEFEAKVEGKKVKTPKKPKAFKRKAV